MNHRPIESLGFVVFCAGGLSGCETSPQTAFPTAQTVARSGAPEADVATLGQGPKIFTTSCTECHVARPIAGYSASSNGGITWV